MAKSGEPGDGLGIVYEGSETWFNAVFLGCGKDGTCLLVFMVTELISPCSGLPAKCGAPRSTEEQLQARPAPLTGVQLW